MNTNYYQVVDMTDDEKRNMYNQLSKQELVEIVMQQEKALFIIDNTGSTPNVIPTSSCCDSMLSVAASVSLYSVNPIKIS